MGLLSRLFGRQTSSTVREISVQDLKAGLEAGDSPAIVDVRETWEWQGGHLAGAIHIPLNALPARLVELDPARDTVVYCHLGQRSWHAAAYMAQQGFTSVTSLAGGIEAWERLQRRGQ
jgi:rhodanese-related sulfurtransferase